MKKILFLSILLSNVIVSQTYNKIIGIYSTELNQKELRGKSRQTKATFYSNNGSLVIEDNLAAIRLDDLKSDTISKNAPPIPLRFETTIQKNLSTILKENKNSNLIQVEGTLSINGISKPSVAYWVPIQFNAASNEILIDFEIKFMCEDFNLTDLKFPFTKLVEFEIEDGYISKIE